jgi:transcriptional regulator with XRE-family HTH domain
VKKKVREALSIAARGRRRKPGPPDALGRFGPYLKERRRAKKLSIRALAKRAEMAHTNIFQFERLGKNPRLTELVALAGAFKEPLLTFMQPLG